MLICMGTKSVQHDIIIMGRQFWNIRTFNHNLQPIGYLNNHLEVTKDGKPGTIPIIPLSWLENQMAASKRHIAELEKQIKQLRQKTKTL